MKTFRLLPVAYCLLLLFPASAQTTFQKTFGGPSVGKSAQQTADGGYIITGWIFNSSTSDVYLVKTDANGDTLWTKSFGGAWMDFGHAVQQTADGGYIISGNALSFNSGTNSHVYLIKTDANGDLMWSKTFGGIYEEDGNSVQQTADGGYIITGVTLSFGAVDSDVYLIKTDANGDELWSRTFGGPGPDESYSVQQTTDGGYIIAGHTTIIDSLWGDLYLIKTDPNGDTLWTKAFGGPSYDDGESVQQTIDGGYILAGSTGSFGNVDVYLVKTDTNGNFLWSKTYGAIGMYGDLGYSVRQTTDQGYIIAGYTDSFGAGGEDIYLIKTDVNGDTLWTKTFGGSNIDIAYSVQQTTDHGYIITGYTVSFSAGSFDLYLIKTDSLGNSGCNEGIPTTIVTTPATQATNLVSFVTAPSSIVTAPPTIVSSGSIDSTLCITVGISPLSFGEGSGVRFSPNPSQGNFTITFPNSINSGEVQIFNAYGTKIFTQNIHNTSNTEIHLKSVPGGIYFVGVWDGEKYFCNKIIIAKV